VHPDQANVCEYDNDLWRVLALLANPDLKPALMWLLGLPDDDVYQPSIAGCRQAQRRLAADDIEELIAKYRSGVPVRTLAAAIRVNRTTVLDHLDRNGMARRPCVRLLTDELVADAAAHYVAGEVAGHGRRSVWCQRTNHRTGVRASRR
jgi:hypothetical protein